MHAHILFGGTRSSRAEHIHSKITPQSELIHIFTEKSSITIKQVQDLSGPLSIAPRLPRVVWIEEADLLTTPAQNALLKMLEEPPESTTFYLTCLSQNPLLPTIRSRCLSLKLGGANASTPDTLSSLKDLMSLTPGDRLMNLVKRDRSESIIWISQVEQALRDKLKEPGLASKNYQLLAKIARLAQDAHFQFSANCSVSLTTQVFLLSLPKTK